MPPAIWSVGFHIECPVLVHVGSHAVPRERTRGMGSLNESKFADELSPISEVGSRKLGDGQDLCVVETSGYAPTSLEGRLPHGTTTGAAVISRLPGSRLALLDQQTFPGEARACIDTTRASSVVQLELLSLKPLTK